MGLTQWSETGQRVAATCRPACHCYCGGQVTTAVVGGSPPLHASGMESTSAESTASRVTQPTWQEAMGGLMLTNL